MLSIQKWQFSMSASEWRVNGRLSCAEANAPAVAGNAAYVLFSVLMNFYLTVKEEQELMEEMNEDEPIKAKKRK